MSFSLELLPIEPILWIIAPHICYIVNVFLKSIPILGTCNIKGFTGASTTTTGEKRQRKGKGERWQWQGET